MELKKLKIRKSRVNLSSKETYVLSLFGVDVYFHEMIEFGDITLHFNGLPICMVDSKLIDIVQLSKDFKEL